MISGVGQKQPKLSRSALAARGPSEMRDAIHGAWGPVLKLPSTSAGATGAILLDHAARWVDAQVDSPTAESFRLAASRARQSAPGREGIAYRFWAVEGSVAPDSLLGVFWSMADGCATAAGFNRATMDLVPKGDEATDAVEVTQAAMATRPLSLKSTDSKLVVAKLAQVPPKLPDMVGIADLFAQAPERTHPRNEPGGRIGTNTTAEYLPTYAQQLFFAHACKSWPGSCTGRGGSARIRLCQEMLA